MKRRRILFLVVGQALLLHGTLFSQELLQAPRPGSSRWGREDQRGAANLQTAAKVLEAAQLIKTGKVYQLGRVYEQGMPLFGQRQFTRLMPEPFGPAGKNQLVALEELLIAEIGQVGTQLDGLGHVGIADVFYNGNVRRDFQSASGLTKLGIENVGVFLTRGILLDITGLKGVARLEKGREITAQDLRDALRRQNLTIRAGDVVLIHTGWGQLWNVDNALYTSGEPGIDASAARFLAEQQISLVGSDTWGLDAVRQVDPAFEIPAHQILLTLNGIYNLENLDTSELARDWIYEFAFFFAPLRLKGFTGSPGNPVAIR